MTKKLMGIYCRISRLKEEGKDKSIKEQKLLGIEKANKLGYDYELYIDEGLSAATDDINKRPQFRRFLDDIKEKKLHAIFGYDQSRFERNPQVRYLFTSSVKEHIKEYYTHIDGLVNLKDPQVELMSNIVSVFNQYYVTLTRHKVRSVLLRNAREGKVHGVPPYGYKKDKNGYYAIDKEESKVVKKIYDLSLSGKGTSSIAEVLNNKGILTRYNKIGGQMKIRDKYSKEVSVRAKKDVKWVGNSVLGIIKNSIYKGERKYQDEVFTVPAIISSSLWDKTNENLQLNRTSSNTKAKYEYLLKGKIRCGKCGRNYYGKRRANKKDNFYMCSSKRTKESCGNRSINIDRLDDFIWYRIVNSEYFLKVLRKDFDFDTNKTDELEEELKQMKKSIKPIEAKRSRLIDAFTNDIITQEELDEKLGELTKSSNRIKEGIENIEYRIDKMGGASKLLKNFQQFQSKLDYFKNELTFEDMRYFVQMFIDEIVVLYNEKEKEYEIDIYFSFSPSDFDNDGKKYRELESLAIPKLQRKDLFTTLHARATSLIVW